MAILKNAAINEPRIGYNPADDTLRGLLIEEQRANSLLNNRNLGGAGWVGSAGAAQNETGIDGAANKAWTVTDSDAGDSSDIRQSITVPDDSNRHTVSLYVKKTAATHYSSVRLALVGGTLVGGGNGDALIRQSDGAKGATGSDIVLHEVTDVGDWWRMVIAIDNNSTGNTSLQVRVFPAVNTDGSTIFDVAATGDIIVDFPQVELNALFASSPIETAGSAVTRAADNVTSAIVGTLPDEWSVVFEGTTAPGTISDFQRLFQYHDGGTENRLELRRAASGDLRLFSGVAAATTINAFNLGVVANSTALKVALAVAAPGVRLSVNGGVVQTFSGGVASAAFTAREIGRFISGSGYWGGWIKNLTEIPRALSDAELIAESTL